MKHKSLFNRVLLLLAPVFLLLTASVSAEPTKLTFLHFNDIYQLSGVKGNGGFAELSTLIKAEKARSPNTVVTFGGDLISPSIMSGLSKGTEMIALMNAVGTDIAVLGNHEFDFGPEVTAERISESTFPWLGTNIFDGAGNVALGAQSAMIMEVGGFKVGFFGILTPETVFLSQPGKDIRFGDVVGTANAAVKALTESGAEIIIALTHLDLAKDEDLTEQVEGLHAVLAGHDHVAATFVKNDVPVMQSGADGIYLGVLDLDVEWIESRGKKRLSVLPSWKMVATRGVTPDPEIKAIIDNYEAALDKELSVPIGKTAILLDSTRGTVRSTEAAIGSLISDAMRAEVKADIGFTNGGGIRGDRLYDPGTVLTRKDILTELPFGNVTVLLELSGADVKEMLETGVSKVEDVAGRFGQVSGVAFTYDKALPSGARITEVTVGGAPLEMDKIYTVATNDYIADGGDGYAVLKGKKQLIDASGGTLMATTVMNYIRDMDGINKVPGGRITEK
ncbi:bifunctional metallophosphatase/5'-nucleotidase [Sneathiella litorea]|uniref:Bifunctional metallophosphatase/5'-nucleotidase n=1 Tax=Sneathiella litorea TaxID=2606216 RepID=A0A6L8WBK1_9PROT|nr:5'-nucleotidase C-terminal domain-containing protein [Sneathiella litorea]MZR32029.1 bifunctional metallophosphatase/5'-nucleotidase [Sneathiella litorea]